MDPLPVSSSRVRGERKLALVFLRRFIVNLKPRNTIVYIDGFNLYYSLRYTPYKWLNLQKLIQNIMNPSDYKISKIRYFTAISKNQNSAKKQDLYLRALKTLNNFDIILGKHKKRQIKGRLVKKKFGKEYVSDKTVRIARYEEKETDVNIASYIVYDSCKENTDCVVLISNDTDLQTPLSIVKRKLKKKVIIITPTQDSERNSNVIQVNKAHADLKKASHTNIKITEKHLKNSQFPDKVGKVFKPKHWSH